MKVSVELKLRMISELPNKGRFAEYEDSGAKLLTCPHHTAALRANPYLGDRDMAAQYLGVADGKIVGVVSPFVLRVIADGNVYEACACTGQVVDVAYRKSGFAIELNEGMGKFPSDGVSINFNVSYAARRLAKMMGAVLFEAKRFVLVRRSENILSEKIAGWKGRLVCRCANVLFGVHRWGVRVFVLWRTRKWSFVEVKSSDSNEITDYARMIASDGHRFREDGSEAWIKWVLDHDFGPVDAAKKSLYQVRIGDRRLGYVMTRMTGKRARVLDWQVEPADECFLPLMLLRAVLMLEKFSDVMLIAVCQDDVGLVKGLKKFLLPTLPDQVACIGAAEDSPLRQHDGWDCGKNWRVRPSMGDSAFY